jgi:RNA 3'-terminal phosphate cyclase (ATP)
LFEIDGSKESGSGTILRLAVALAAIAAEPLHIYNIRQNRPQPGLKPQHLESVLTAAKLCNAETEGALLNSRELWFKPGEIRSGAFEAEIGTAGSIPMLLLTVLPICFSAKGTISLHVTKGGTDVSHSPTISYMQNIFLKVLKHMNFEASITVTKYGYYPKGNGELTMITKPCRLPKPLCLESFGKLESLKGISICTFLSERRVAERQAKAAADYLSGNGYAADVQIINDRSNPLQRGSSIVLWAETDTGAILGADAIGELKKTSEVVGLEAARILVGEISAMPTVDSHLADMLVPYVALAEGTSTYLTRRVSEHLRANIWLAEKMLGVRFNVSEVNHLFRIEKGG